MGQQRARPAGQKQLRVVAKHEESSGSSVQSHEPVRSCHTPQAVESESSATGSDPLVLQNYSLVVPTWSVSDPFCLHEPCLASSSSSSGQDRQLSSLPPLSQKGSNGDALLQPAFRSGSSMANVVQMWRERRYRERTQLAYELAHGQQTDALLAEAAWAVMDLLPSTNDGWVQRIKVAAAAAQWVSFQLAQQGQLLPPDGVLDAQGGVLPAQGTWLRSMLLLARTLHAAEATSTISGGHYSASVPGDVVWLLSRLLPEELIGARFMIMHLLSSRREWEQLLALCDCGLGDNLPPDTVTLAVAYNKALAAFHVLGGEHPDALAAVAAALKLDGCRWVPLLLGAGAVSSPDLGPLLLLGSKQEATAYCHNHGVAWLVDSPFDEDAEGEWSFKAGAPISMGPSLLWLLEKAGLQQLQKPMDKDRVSLMLFNTYSWDAAWRGVVGEVVEQMNLGYGAGRARVIPPEARPRLLRCELVLLCSLAASTANLPPVDAGPGVWVGVADMIGAGISSVKERLVDCAKVVYDMARQLLLTCQAQQGPWQGAWPGELAHAAVTLAELQPARVRWLWQAGEIQWAKDAAADLLQTQQALHRRSSSSGAARGSGSGASSGSLLQPAAVQFSLQGVQALQEFLNQQTLEACRSSSKGGKGGVKSSKPGSSSSSSSSRSRLTMVAGGSVGGNVGSAGVRGSSRAVISYSPYEPLAKVDEFCRLFFDAAGGLDVVEQMLQQGSTVGLTMQGLQELQRGAGAKRQQQQQQQPWLQLLLCVSDKACPCCGCIDLELDGVKHQHRHQQQQHRQQQQKQQKQHAAGRPSGSRASASAVAGAGTAAVGTAAGLKPGAGHAAAAPDVATTAAAVAALESSISSLSAMQHALKQVVAALNAKPHAHIASMLLTVYQRMQDVYSVVAASATAAAPVPQISYSTPLLEFDSMHKAADRTGDALRQLMLLVFERVASLSKCLGQYQQSLSTRAAAHKHASDLARERWCEGDLQILYAVQAHCKLPASNSSTRGSTSTSSSGSSGAQRASKLHAAAGVAVDGVFSALQQLARGAAAAVLDWDKEVRDAFDGLPLNAEHQQLTGQPQQELEQQQQQQQQQQPRRQRFEQQPEQEQQQLRQQLEHAKWRSIGCTKLHLSALGQLLQMQRQESMRARATAAATAARPEARGNSNGSGRLQQQQQQRRDVVKQADELQDSDDADLDAGNHPCGCRCEVCRAEAAYQEQQQRESSLPLLQQRLQDLWRSTAPAAAAAACAKLKHAAVMAGGPEAAAATAARTWEGLLELLAASDTTRMLAVAANSAPGPEVAALAAALQAAAVPEGQPAAPGAQPAAGHVLHVPERVREMNKALKFVEWKMWGVSVEVAGASAAPAAAVVRELPAAPAAAAAAGDAAAAAAGGTAGGACSRTATGSSCGGEAAGAAVASGVAVRKREAPPDDGAGGSTASGSTAGGSSSGGKAPGTAAAAAAAAWQPSAAQWPPGQQADSGQQRFVFGGDGAEQQQEQQHSPATAVPAAAGSADVCNTTAERDLEAGRRSSDGVAMRQAVPQAAAAAADTLHGRMAEAGRVPASNGSDDTAHGGSSSSSGGALLAGLVSGLHLADASGTQYSSSSVGGSSDAGAAGGRQAAAAPAASSQPVYAAVPRQRPVDAPALASAHAAAASSAGGAPAGGPAVASATVNDASGGSGNSSNSSSSSRGKVCAACGQVFPKLRRCAGCAAAGLFTGYCSETCQKAAWPLHKKECGGRGKQRQ